MSRLAELIQELCPNGVEHKPLSELFNTRNGYTPSKSNPEFWTDGTVPWFRMEDIRENGRILSEATQYVSRSAVKGNLFPANSIIVATSATIGEHALITVPSLANQRFTYLMLKDEYKDVFDSKFLYYYCFKLDEYCKECLNQGNFASVDMKKFAKFEFPLVPLSVQREIVRILDNYSEVVAGLNDALSAELTARRKQYEYYRDSLLTPPFGMVKQADLFAANTATGRGTLVPSKSVYEYKRLEEIAEINRGVRVTRDILSQENNVPVYQNALTPLGFYNKSNRIANTTFVISAGAAGQVGFSAVDFWAADDCFTFDNLKNVNSKFIFHVFKN